MLADKYVYPKGRQPARIEVAEPVVFPDQGIWHPMAPAIWNLKEYLNWYENRSEVGGGPLIGLVLQRSRIVTGDDARYGLIQLEYRGARVIPVFCGGLDFQTGEQLLL